MRPVALLTDFGLEDHYVGVMHAVLEREAPGVARIDLQHTLRAGDIWSGCFHLLCVWPHLPANAVVTAVVDPGVGTRRRAVAALIGDRWLVAPDNGLAAAVDGAAEARLLDAERMQLPMLSATFHGRDLFAPAAARLARGTDPSRIGPEVPPASLIASPLQPPRPIQGGLCGVVMHVDRFGNVITNLRAADVPRGAEVRAGSARVTRRVRTYAEAERGEAVVLEGSSGFLEIALDRGPASRLLELRRGTAVQAKWTDDKPEE